MNRAGLTSLLAAVLGVGCDAPYGTYLDAIPVPDAPTPSGPTEVFVAIDGLSRAAYDEARAAGAFASYADGDLVTPFPGTSDYAWTRILRTGSLPGYEIQYFDAGKNRLEKAGLAGVLEHPVREGLRSYPCYARFDFLGDGYFWMKRGYDDPEAALSPTLDEMFWVVARRARTQAAVLVYLLNIDVLGHWGGQRRAAAALVEIDRRIQAFKAQHPGRFRFTLFGDHGNAHIRSRLVDPRQLLRDVGVTPVDALGGGDLQAVPIVHVRVNYVAVHAAPAHIAAVAERASRHPDVELAVARLQPTGFEFGVFKAGAQHRFVRTAAGDFVLEDPALWQSSFGVDLEGVGHRQQNLHRVSDAEAFALFAPTAFPDLLARVAGAFLHPAASLPADIILSLPDDVASFGFHVPGSGDSDAVDGFHGGLGRKASLSVLASEAMRPSAMVRADDLLDLFPALRSP